MSESLPLKLPQLSRYGREDSTYTHNSKHIIFETAPSENFISMAKNCLKSPIKTLNVLELFLPWKLTGVVKIRAILCQFNILATFYPEWEGTL